MYRTALLLLVTLLPHHRGAGAQVKRIYAQCMQIKGTIRDLKSHRWGFALRYARTHRPEHLEALLLVAALATLVLWLWGLVAYARQWSRHFQANIEWHGNGPWYSSAKSCGAIIASSSLSPSCSTL